MQQNEPVLNEEISESVETPSKMTFEQIESVIGQDIEDVEDFNTSEVSQLREDSYYYYYGNELGNEQPNRSSYVSKDVMSTVEGIKALILETFEAHKNICYFPPLSKNDYFKAKEATAYANHVFYVENMGHKILMDVSHDGLVAKTGIMKTYWNTSFKLDTITFEGISEEEYKLVKESNIEIINEDINPSQDPEAIAQFQQQAEQAQQQIQQIMQGAQQQQPIQEGQEQPPDPEQQIQQIQQGLEEAHAQIPQVYSGSISYKVDTSSVKVEVVPPEDFLISRNATCLEDADMIVHRKLVTKSFLVEFGFPLEMISELKGADTFTLLTDNEKAARNSFDSTDQTFLNGRSNTKEMEKVVLYEAYRKIDIEGNGVAKLYKCYYCSGKLLSYEEVSEIPFNVFSPYPISHKFYGMSVYDIIKHIQMSKSVIQRQIIDNLVLTNNAKFIGDLGFIRNVRDLVENKPGSVIDSTNIDAIKQFPVAQMNPETFNILSMIEEDKVSTTGFSKLAQGIDPSAISNQNSYNLIQSQTNAGNRRPMMIAKNLAFDCLAPVMKRIYLLGKSFENKEKMIEIGGDYVQVTPSTFIYRDLVRVNVALTPDEQIKQAQSLLSLHQTFIASPALALNYGTNQQYFLFEKAMEFMNIDCRDFILLNPQSPEYQQALQGQQQQQEQQAQQAQQMQELEMQVKQTQSQLFSTQAQVEVMKVQTQDQYNQSKLMVESTLDKKKSDLDLRKQEHQENVDFAEIEIKKKEVQIKSKQANKGVVSGTNKGTSEPKSERNLKQ